MKRRTAKDLIAASKPTVEEAVAAYREREKARQARATNDELLSQVEALEQRLAVWADIRKYERALPPLAGARKGRVLSTDKREAVAVALASDWHVGERVDPARVMGLNSYDPETARIRAARFFEGVEWLIREQQSMFAVNTLLLWLGGDFISGYIHAELVESNFMSPTKETRYAKQLIKEGFKTLHKRYPDLRVRCLCSIGNHDRTTEKTRIGSATQNSYTWMMYHDLAELFEGEEWIEFQIADGHHLLTQVYDMRIHFHHGDSVRSNGGIGGIDVPLNRAVAQWRNKYKSDLTCVGHFHRYQSGERLVTNGSLIGYGAYSDWLASADPEPARQAFFLVDRKRGKCQATPIWCAE